MLCRLRFWRDFVLYSFLVVLHTFLTEYRGAGTKKAQKSSHVQHLPMSEKRLLARVAPADSECYSTSVAARLATSGPTGNASFAEKTGDEKGKLERAEYYVVDMRGWIQFLYEGKRTICAYIMEAMTAGGWKSSWQQIRIPSKVRYSFRNQDEHHERWQRAS